MTGINGMSAAKSIGNRPFIEDPYYSENGLLKLGYTHSKSFQIETFLNFDTFDYSFDNGAYTDSNINTGKQNQIRIGVKPTYNYEKGNVFAIASFNKVKRELFGNEYEGSSTHIELVNRYQFLTNLEVIAGANYQKHSNQTNSPWGTINKDIANFNSIDFYSSVVYTTDFKLTLNAGVRLTKHSNYETHMVYHVNPSYNLFFSDAATIKLLTSYSTAFISPSLYQLFSVYGNQDLQPETNKTFEFGFESTYKDWFKFDAVYFDRVEREAIVFNNLSAAPWGKYGNALTTIKVKGVESTIVLKPLNKIKVNLGYTYTDKNAESDYIPKNKLTSSIEYAPTTKAFISLVYKNVGERTGKYYDASIFSTVEKQLPSYQLLDLNVNYKLANEIVTLFGSASNIFNEDYEETLGYNTKGRNIKLGIRLQF
jgi:vitamin B12 transporter